VRDAWVSPCDLPCVTTRAHGKETNATCGGLEVTCIVSLSTALGKVTQAVDSRWRICRQGFSDSSIGMQTKSGSFQSGGPLTAATSSHKQPRRDVRSIIDADTTWLDAISPLKTIKYQMPKENFCGPRQTTLIYSTTLIQITSTHPCSIRLPPSSRSGATHHRMSTSEI
jgi:hypothetical protein